MSEPTAKDQIVALRATGASHREIAERVGVVRSYVAKVLEGDAIPREPGERRDGGQYTPSKSGTDWYPDVPAYIRITLRSRNQSVPRALGE